MTLRGVPVLQFGSIHHPLYAELNNLFQPLLTDQMRPNDGFIFTPDRVTPAMLRHCPFLAQNMMIGRRLQYASIEALWQGLKSKNWATFLEFTASGKYGGLDSHASILRRLFGKPEEVERRFKLYCKQHLGGMVPKLVGHPKYGKVLGLESEDFDYSREFLDPAEEREIWIALLQLKFEQNVDARRTLMEGTFDEDNNACYLLVEQNSHPHWGGRLVTGQNQEDGHIQGENVMGQYLMEVRASLCSC